MDPRGALEDQVEVVNDEQVGQRVLRSVRTVADFIESTWLSADGG